MSVRNDGTIDTSDYISDQDYDAFRRGYVEAMLWANTLVLHNDTDEYEFEDVIYLYNSPGKWWEDTPVDLDDADAFLRAHRDLMVTANDDLYAHGIDFALSRNRHGAGFWDRGYGDVGDYLTDEAHGFGEHVVYLDNEDDA